MFRLSHYIQQLITPTEITHFRKASAPVVIWNLTRRCNLTCQHCYSTSANRFFPNELTTEQIFTVMTDLKVFKVPVLILSGGEPLLHPNIFEISRQAKAMGFYVALSTNGSLITQDNIDIIKMINYDYIGISLDGLAKTHDQFRRQQGAFDLAWQGIELCLEQQIKVGVRYTLTQTNYADFYDLVALINQRGISKFYLSHLNYGGRGFVNRKTDALFSQTREIMHWLFNTAYQRQAQGLACEWVTGNNDADAVYFLHWVKQYHPQFWNVIDKQLQQWGGNASGIQVANIDPLGEVHADTFWWHYSLGNVKNRSFSEIWQDVSNSLMAGLKQRPRQLKGRCGQCAYLSICNGNSRVRAHQAFNDFWAEDPGCYLSENEIS